MKRQPSPLQRPLDDGPRDGTEVWRAIDGVELCHWDRWLLRLSLVELGGLDALAAQFKERRDAPNQYANRDGEAEALLLQTKDLKRRLLAVKLTAGGVLDATERHSDWLLKKAHKRVFHDGPTRRTPVMLATPKKVLRERAMRGHWDRFPISPAPFAVALAQETDRRYYELRSVGVFVRGIERVVKRLTKGGGVAQRLGVHRGALTVIIESMEKVDDSDADVAVMFREIEHVYHDDLLTFAAHPGLLRDFLELSVWEDYGLMKDPSELFTRLPVEHAEPAYAELVDIIAELEREELKYTLEKARRLAATFTDPNKKKRRV